MVHLHWPKQNVPLKREYKPLGIFSKHMRCNESNFFSYIIRTKLNEDLITELESPHKETQIVTDEFPHEDVKTVPCPTCGRKFVEGSLEKHLRVCTKVFKEKRTRFDSSAKRTNSHEKPLFEQKERAL